MREGYVLVDYHNLHDAWSAGFQKPPSGMLRVSREKHMASIQYVIDKLLSNITSCLKIEECLPRTLIIRLYGGWFHDSEFTDHAGMIARAIRNTPAYIRQTRSLRVLFDLATSLIDARDEPIHNTVQIKNNLPSITFRIPPDRCMQPHACELAPLQKDWREIPCILPHCPIKLKDGVKSKREQKCVDVHLACDFFSLSRQQSSDTLICLVTNDYDLFPAMRASVTPRAEGGPRLLWAFSQPYERRPFIDILDRIGVRTVYLAS